MLLLPGSKSSSRRERIWHIAPSWQKVSTSRVSDSHGEGNEVRNLSVRQRQDTGITNWLLGSLSPVSPAASQREVSSFFGELLPALEEEVRALLDEAALSRSQSLSSDCLKKDSAAFHYYTGLVDYA